MASSFGFCLLGGGLLDLRLPMFSKQGTQTDLLRQVKGASQVLLLDHHPKRQGMDKEQLSKATTPLSGPRSKMEHAPGVVKFM